MRMRRGGVDGMEAGESGVSGDHGVLLSGLEGPAPSRGKPLNVSRSALPRGSLPIRQQGIHANTWNDSLASVCTPASVPPQDIVIGGAGQASTVDSLRVCTPASVPSIDATVEQKFKCARTKNKKSETNDEAKNESNNGASNESNSKANDKENTETKAKKDYETVIPEIDTEKTSKIKSINLEAMNNNNRELMEDDEMSSENETNSSSAENTESITKELARKHNRNIRRKENKLKAKGNQRNDSNAELETSRLRKASEENAKVSAEMRKVVIKRINQLSNEKSTFVSIKELLKKQLRTSKRKSSQDFHDTESKRQKQFETEKVIFESETGPVVFEFRKLSNDAKVRLFEKIGGNISLNSTTDCNEVKSLGMPLQTKTIQGDGNCFFRAISYALTNDEKYHMKVRNAVVNHMLMNQEKFTSHLRSGYQNVAEYVLKKKMLRTGIWATEVEILATSHLLSTNIYIHEENLSWLLFSPKQTDKTCHVEEESIYLQHAYRSHYDVVLSVEENDTGESASTLMENHNATVKIDENTYKEMKTGDLEKEKCTILEKNCLDVNVQMSNIVSVCQENTHAGKISQNVDEHRVVKGSCHQGHPKFLDNAGKQCVMNSLSALMFSKVKHMSIWTSGDIDQVLIQGNETYSYLRNSSTMHHDYVSIAEVPRILECFDRMFRFEFHESMSGMFGNEVDFDAFNIFTLKEALQIALDQSVNGIFITFKENTFIVVKDGGRYYIFDSHSRSSSGLQVPSGTSILLNYTSIEDVYVHCKNLAASMNAMSNNMFEITAVNVYVDCNMLEYFPSTHDENDDTHDENGEVLPVANDTNFEMQQGELKKNTL